MDILTIKGLFWSEVPVAIVFLLTSAAMILHVLPTVSLTASPRSGIKARSRQPFG